MLAVPGTTSLACVISLTQAYFLRIINKKVVLSATSKIDHTNQSANGRLGLQTSLFMASQQVTILPASGQTQDLAF